MTPESTIVEIAVADDRFSILVEAVSKAGLVDALSAEGPYTVFAPTNDAFGLLLTELDLSGLGDIDEPTLDAVLKVHVVAGANVFDTDLSDNLTVSTLGGEADRSTAVLLKHSPSPLLL